LQPGFIDISARRSDGGDVTELGIAERAAAVLRDELATGALANIDHAVRMWSAREPGVYHVEAARRVLSDIESFVEGVLDVLVAAGNALSDLHPAGWASPGSVAQICTRLANETRQPVEAAFACTDLIAPPNKVIRAERVRVSPLRVQIPPGETVNLAIAVLVPENASPGIYQALLQSPDIAGLRALVTVPVG